MLITLILQIVVTVISSLTENGVINAVYLGGFPFTLLNILCCLRFSTLLAQKSSALEKLVYKSAALEKILVTISGSASKIHTSDFFKNVLKQMQVVSGATTGLIVVYEGGLNSSVVTTAVAVHKQQVIEKFSFSINDIPEDFRDPTQFHIVTEGLSDKYKNVEFYQNIRAQAMISVPMFNQSAQAIGVLSLYFRKPSLPDDSYMNVIKVCASRLAAEYTRELLVKELEDIAYLDFQTKLPNLVLLNKKLMVTQAECAAKSRSMVALKVDIDGFADINRKHGFASAEHILRVLGERLNKYASDSVFIARTGGDEFTIVVSNTDEAMEGLLNMHWQAIWALINKTISVDDETFNLKSSAGSVIYPQQVPQNMDVMQCAEFALSQAKQNGKNRLQTFDAEMISSINRRKLIEKELRAALNSDSNEHMFIVYQAKVDNNAKVIGAEALSRWVHPELGAISPVEFVEIAEVSGIIDELGLWCIEQVCKQLSIWQQGSFLPAGRIGINVSAQQFEDLRFVDNLLQLLQTYNVTPSQIDLELTESSLMKNIKSSIKTIHQLREKGFTISLDDFGTGYSSLSYLKELPIDFLKIDRSFVVDAEKGNSLYLLESILSLGKHMKLKTVAEGVEEEAQLQLLSKLGCDYYQGYYFCKPISADAFKAWTLSN